MFFDFDYELAVMLHQIMLIDFWFDQFEWNCLNLVDFDYLYYYNKFLIWLWFFVVNIYDAVADEDVDDDDQCVFGESTFWLMKLALTFVMILLVKR